VIRSAQGQKLDFSGQEATSVATTALQGTYPTVWATGLGSRCDVRLGRIANVILKRLTPACQIFGSDTSVFKRTPTIPFAGLSVDDDIRICFQCRHRVSRDQHDVLIWQFGAEIRQDGEVSADPERRHKIQGRGEPILSRNGDLVIKGHEWMPIREIVAVVTVDAAVPAYCDVGNRLDETLRDVAYRDAVTSLLSGFGGERYPEKWRIYGADNDRIYLGRVRTTVMKQVCRSTTLRAQLDGGIDVVRGQITQRLGQ
jgi:hypothetical protein